MQPWTASLVAGLLLASLTTLAAAPAAGAADVPEWLTQAAAAAPRTFDAKVPAEVLLHDGRQSVGEQGVVESRVLHAVRVLTRAGRQEAVARLAYVTDADRVPLHFAVEYNPARIEAGHSYALAANVLTEGRLRWKQAEPVPDVASAVC